MIISFIHKQKIELKKLKLKAFFPESLAPKCVCALYAGARHTWKNTVNTSGKT